MVFAQMAHSQRGLGSSTWRVASNRAIVAIRRDSSAPMTYRELLIGCGHRRDKRLRVGRNDGWNNLTTLDHNESVKPDIVCDLERPQWGSNAPQGFQVLEESSFDEIHAYEVLEHLGQQV